jgi:hypothetical protein
MAGARRAARMLGIDPDQPGGPAAPKAGAGDEMDERLEQLERLAKLREQGVLTDAGFAEQKRQILEG